MARRSVYSRVNKPRRASTPSYVRPKKGSASVGTLYSDAVFAGFTGLNTMFSNTELADTESPDCMNVVFDNVGAIVKRNGYALATSVGSEIVSILPFFTQRLNKLLLTYGNSIVQYDPATNTKDTTITSSIVANGARFSSTMDTVHSKIYMVDGNAADGLMSWDGTTFTTQIGSNAAAWVANHTYAVDDLVSNDGNIYQCLQAGLSAPTTAWQANHSYNVGDTVTNSSNVYVCITAGTSAASGGPTGTGASITDNTVTWQYVSAATGPSGTDASIPDNQVVWTYISAVGFGPQGKYVLWYKNHLYVAGDVENPNRLYISNQGDPTTWPLLNFIDFDDDIGGITGLSQLGDSIVVFKQYAMFVLKGSDPSNYVVANAYSGGKGTVCHWSIVSVPGALIFLTHDGVYMFNGKTVEAVSLKLDISAWNQNALNGVSAFAYDYKYWLSVPENIPNGPTQTTNNRTYVYNYVYQWWSRHDFGMQSCGIFYGNEEHPQPYFGDTAGKLFEADTGGSDNGAAIDAYFWTKAFDFGSQAHMKMFKKVFVSALAEPGDHSILLTFNQDLGRTFKTVSMPLSGLNPTEWGNFQWGESTWGTSGQVTHYTTTVPGLCRYLSFKVEGNALDAPFTVLELMVQYYVMERVT